MLTSETSISKLIEVGTMSSHAVIKYYKSRKTLRVPTAETQNCIAASMTKIITRMLDVNLLNNCMQMLQTQNMDEVEARILHILQEIDDNLMNERERKEKAKKNKVEKRLKNPNIKCIIPL